MTTRSTALAMRERHIKASYSGHSGLHIIVVRQPAAVPPHDLQIVTNLFFGSEEYAKRVCAALNAGALHDEPAP